MEGRNYDICLNGMVVVFVVVAAGAVEPSKV